jgi:hypothetical protein
VSANSVIISFVVIMFSVRYILNRGTSREALFSIGSVNCGTRVVLW